MQLHLTEYALQDLECFAKYTKKIEPYKYIDGLWKIITQLNFFPKLGKEYCYIKAHMLRKLVYKEHIIFYYIRDEIVYILAIVHHRQNINSKINIIKKKFKF